MRYYSNGFGVKLAQNNELAHIPTFAAVVGYNRHVGRFVTVPTPFAEGVLYVLWSRSNMDE